MIGRRPRLLRWFAPGALALGWLLVAAVASAQQAQGTISGTVRSGTAGAAAVDGVRVQLITVAADGTVATQDTTSRDGRFEFATPADTSFTHLLWAVHRDVQYFAPEPVRLSAELPAAERQITVYETTGEPPPLRVEATVLTVLALDRGNARLTLAREDIVSNPGDRTYTGDAAGVTLRLPAPEAVIEADGRLIGAEGLPDAGSFTLEGGRLAMSAPLKPGQTLVVTRYVVGYDRGRDGYRLRATAPLPTERIELHVPARFVGGLRPVGDATRSEDTELEGERVLVVKLEGEARPGQSAVADLTGLAGRNAPNPLTERRGAALGVVLALLAVAGGFALLRGLRDRGSPGRDPTAGSSTAGSSTAGGAP